MLALQIKRRVFSSVNHNEDTISKSVTATKLIITNNVSFAKNEWDIGMEAFIESFDACYVMLGPNHIKVIIHYSRDVWMDTPHFDEALILILKQHHIYNRSKYFIWNDLVE